MRDKCVLHFTHVKNLPSIIRQGLHSDIRSEGYRCVGNQDIKDRRKHLPCLTVDGRQTVIADYVPFYYAPRSPMLYQISRGGVRGYDEGQEPIIYLECRMQTLWNIHVCCGTDHNAACDFAQVFSDAEQLLDAVDWNLMEARYWSNSDDDPHRKQRRMAEFLVLDHVPFSRVKRIVVYSKKIRERVERTLQKHEKECRVLVEPDWYFS